MGKIISASFLAACLGVAAGWWYFNTDKPLVLASVVAPAKPLPEFSMTYGDGTAMNLSSLRGQKHLLFFGFTHCPDVCPTELAKLATTYKILRADGVQSLPKMTFISVDPQRDKPQMLKDYVRFFDEDFVAAVGDIENTATLAKELGLYYEWIAKVNGKTVKLNTLQPIPELFRDNYVVNHAATVYLINDNASLQAFFLQPQFDPEDLASDIAQLL